MLRAVRHLFRLLAIARSLARHDALFMLDRLDAPPLLRFIARTVSRRGSTGRDGERLAAAFQELGPSFIKLGQVLSTRADLLGEEIAADLAKLQDRLPPFSGERARQTVAEELGAPAEDLFAQFDDEAVAAASIAQVHLAETTDGEAVAVKILRPGIEQAFRRDVDLFYWAAGLIESLVPPARRLKPVRVVETFAEIVEIEMDLRLEAAAAAELRDNFRDEPTFLVPRVDWARTARRVMTLERVRGIRVSDHEKLVAAGHDLNAILEKSARAFFNQVFRDGFFHADMHPGNLFIEDSGNLAVVDFGIMGRLDRPTRHYLAEMLIGFLSGDYRRVAEVHFRAGYVPAHKSVDSFAQACRSIGEPLLGKPLNEISLARLLAQLFQVTGTFEMETQPQLLLLQKTMLQAEGMGRQLNPDINMWELARPLIEAWIRDNLGPEARVREAAEGLRDGLARLPNLIADAERVATMLGDGGVKLHPDTVRTMTGEGRRNPMAVPLWIVAILLVILILTQI